MTKKEIRKLLSQAIDPHQICRVFLRYNHYYRNYFPLKVSERFFLGVEEDDFALDGYSVCRIRDVEEVQIKNDKCFEIIKAEGLVERITVPDVDISDWRSVFLSLQSMNRNIIVENAALDESGDFAIGRIIKVLQDKVRFQPFDADGIWYDYDLDIMYSHITSVTFGSRYVDVFSKYLPPID